MRFVICSPSSTIFASTQIFARRAINFQHIARDDQCFFQGGVLVTLWPMVSTFSALTKPYGTTKRVYIRRGIAWPRIKVTRSRVCSQAGLSCTLYACVFSCRFSSSVYPATESGDDRSRYWDLQTKTQTSCGPRTYRILIIFLRNQPSASNV